MKHLLPFLILLTLTACTVPAVTLTAEVTEEPTPTHTPEPTSTPIPTSTASPPTITPIPTDAPPLFTLTGDSPALAHGGAVSVTTTAPVLFHEGTYYQYAMNFPQSGVTEIRLYTSPDGRTWSPASDTPILTANDVDYDGWMIGMASAVVDHDGLWVLYFSVWQPIRNGRAMIVRATSPSATGPFTPDPDPILEPGEPRAWDGMSVFAPVVLPTEDGYIMFYNGDRGTSSPDSIGMATSPDGITWTKYPDPILTVTEDWEAEGVTEPRVARMQTSGLSDQYVMLYTVIQEGRGERAFGLAFSEDGITWTKHPANPILHPDDVDDLFVHSSTMFCTDDTCSLLVELLDLDNQVSDQWLFEADGAVLP